MQNPAAKISDELTNLDALRAIAVLLVLGDHVLETIAATRGGSYDPYVWYLGRLGVLLFFVHTCFVLMASMERLNSSGWSLARTFYIRRAFRIYPLAALCIVIVVSFGIPALPWLQFKSPAPLDLASNFLLTMNLTDSPEVLTPLWSLPLEVQMYLALPAIFLLTLGARHVPRIAGIYVLSLAAALVLPQITSIFKVAAFAPCFMAGVVAYALCKRWQPRLPAWTWLPFLAALIGLYIGIEEATPGTHHVLLQAAICLALGLAIPLFRQSRAAALNRAAHLVAKYSYGIYLFHCVALWVAYYAVRPESPLMQALLALGLLVALSVASFHLLESPAIRLGARLSRRAPSPVVAKAQPGTPPA